MLSLQEEVRVTSAYTRGARILECLHILFQVKLNDYARWILNLTHLSSHVLVPGAPGYHHLHPCSRSILHQWTSSVLLEFSGVVGGLEEHDHPSIKSVLIVCNTLLDLTNPTAITATSLSQQPVDHLNWWQYQKHWYFIPSCKKTCLNKDWYFLSHTFQSLATLSSFYYYFFPSLSSSPHSDQY